MNLGNEPVVWLDLETGGTDPQRHQITQVAAIATMRGSMEERGEPFERKVVLVDGKYTDKALEVQGYTPERWADAIPMFEVLEEFGAWLRNNNHTHSATSKKGNTYEVAHLGGHNLGFDVDFLNATCKRMTGGERGYWLPVTKWAGGWLDTLHMAKWVGALYGHKHTSLQLGDLCDYYELPHPEDHDALGDVRATILLARTLANQLRYDWASEQ